MNLFFNKLTFQSIHILFGRVLLRSKKVYRNCQHMMRFLLLVSMLGVTPVLVQAQAQQQTQNPGSALMSIINLLLDDEDPASEVPGNGGGNGNTGGGAGAGGGTPGSDGSGNGGSTGAADLISVNITPPHLDSANAGTLPGELAVSSSGTATYSIPLVVPPGTAGVAPNLSLSYSGKAGNGIYGLGWSLDGLSSIHRCGKTIAQDGINVRINFENSDRLCLDGKRLVLANLPLSDVNYWANGAEYRTEIDEFSRITKIDSNGRTSFKVELKSGRIAIYGGTADSNIQAVVKPISGGEGAKQPQPKSGALSWSMSSNEDRFGNYVKYSYYQDPDTGESVPTFIRYGGRGLTSHAAVSFTFEARPDAWKRYVDEARTDMRSRLSHIRTYVGSNLDGDVIVNGTIVRDYQVTYEQSPTSGRSMVKEVQVSARNPQSGVMESLPATKFDWGRPDPAKTPGFVSRGIWPNAPVMTTHGPHSGVVANAGILHVAINHDDYFSFADFENHGLTDVLEKRVASPIQPYSHDAEKFVNSNPIKPGTLVDQYAYYHNNGAGFTKYQYGLNTGEKFAVLEIGDFDGDGSPDLVVSTSNGPKICISPLSKGVPASAAVKIVFTCASAADRPAIGSNDIYDIPYVVDVDGDGRSALYGQVSASTGGSDLYVQNQKIFDSKPPLGVLAYEYQMYGMTVLPQQAYVGITDMVDVNGSGKPQDVRWSAPYYILDQTDSDGTVVRTPQWVNLLPQVSVTAFRRPGMPDTPPVGYSYAEYESPGTYPNRGWAPYKFESPHPGGSVGADFNGTGYASVAFSFLEQKTDPATQIAYASRAELTFCLSTGRALDCNVRRKYSGDQYVSVRAIGDFVGDGHSQILVESNRTFTNRLPVPTSELQVCRVMGDDTSGTVSDSNILCVPWAGVKIPFATSFTEAVDKIFFMDLLGTGRMQLVYYHAGKMGPNNVWQGDDRWEIFEPLDVAVTGQALDMLYQVTDGIGGRSTLTYEDGIPSGKVTQSTNNSLTYPQRGVRSAGKYVTRMSVTNGVSADRSTAYRYHDAAMDVIGRGALGFAQVTSTDEQTGISTMTTYGQLWPLTGYALSITRSSANCPLSEVKNRMAVKRIVQSNGAETVFPFIAGSIEKRKDLNCSDMGSTTLAGIDATDVEYDNWGNLLKSESTTSGSAVNPGASVAAAVTNKYLTADVGHWQVGLMESTSIKKTLRSANSSKSITRKSAFTYRTDFSGLVKTLTVEPDNAALKFVTTYDRNEFGLVEKKAVSWTDQFSGLQSRANAFEYDTNGRFATKYVNELSHEESSTFSAATGAKTSLKDANQLRTTWTTDGFGSLLVELRPDGNETRNYLKKCDSSCPAGASTAKVTEFFNGNSRIAPAQISHADSAGHVIHGVTWGFDGRMIELAQNYDARGRPFESFRPYYTGETAYLEKRVSYDDLDRVISLVTKNEAGGEQTETTKYEGFVVTQRNAKAQARLVFRDASGRVERITDALNGNTSFNYDPFDNLTETIDPNSNVIRVSYDDRGRKIELNDPNLGRITYSVDPIGQVRAEVNPEQRKKGQATTLGYDKLGRLTDRIEPSLSSHWVFDTAVKGIGKLAEAYTGTLNQKDYRRVHSYDSVGRLLSTTQFIRGIEYSSSPTYDAWGRVVNQLTRRSSAGAVISNKNFGIRYNNYGYLARVERDRTTLWRVDRQDATQLVTDATLGNGLTQTRIYNPFTGRLSDAVLKTASQEQRLQEGYQYDSLGNVSLRTQAWDNANFSESFVYDDLNRLKTSQVLGQAVMTYTYDGVGNLKSKSGVGDYDYGSQGDGALRPNAVKTVGANSYSYDDNGNLLIGGGRTIAWTSFDMPDVITKGAQSSTFVYGPEHQRVVQTRQDGSSTVYADGQEIETNSSGTTVRTYWPLGLGMEVNRGGLVELNWLHKDRLGSIAGVTNESGDLRERLEYDTWGKRRTLDGASTPDSLDGQVDNKGYTGHEMLDALDLVHMNGRVYDPLLARFISGDPVLQDPFNGQSYNRYSYVMNNPTNFTDATGFQADIPQVDVPGTSPNTGAMLGVVNSPGSAAREAPRPAPKADAKNSGATGKKPVTVPSYIDAKASVKTAGGGGLLKILWNLITGAYSVTSDEENDAWGAALRAAQEQGPAATAEFLRRYPPGTAVIETVVVSGASLLKAPMGRFPISPPSQGISALEKIAVLNAANAPASKQGLSEVARAWDKHALRAGSTFKPLTGNVANKNEMGSKFIQGVLDNPKTIRSELGRGGVEYRGPTGQGFRLDADGTFSGVLDPKR